MYQSNITQNQLKLLDLNKSQNISRIVNITDVIIIVNIAKVLRLVNITVSVDNVNIVKVLRFVNITKDVIDVKTAKVLESVITTYNVITVLYVVLYHYCHVNSHSVNMKQK